MANTSQKSEKIVFFIDKQKFEWDSNQITVSKLFELASEDPKETTMALKEGNDIHKYTDMNATVDLKNGMKFIVFHNEPTPVS
jgi:hypothetical protein